MFNVSRKSKTQDKVITEINVKKVQKQLAAVPQHFVEPVWEYWKEKRASRSNMPLIRRFEVCFKTRNANLAACSPSDSTSYATRRLSSSSILFFHILLNVTE